MKNEYGIEMNGKNCFCHNKQRCKDRDCSVCEMFKPKSKVYRERIMELQNKVWNTRNYLEKQDSSNSSEIPNSSKELMEFVKFCRNASANDIRQIHDRARDLIANYKECCEKSCKEENATFKPLVPKWVSHYGGGESLDVSISQYKKLRFRIYDTDGSSNFKYHCDCTVINFISDKDSCIFEEVGEFDTLEEAKAKANECIKELGERLVYFSNNIRTNDELES